MAVLERAAFDPWEDKIVFLGDYIDKGKRSKDVVTTLSALTSNHPDRAVCLRGNHEQMMIDYCGGVAFGKDGGWITSDSFNGRKDLWIQNGGWATVNSYMGPYGGYFEPDVEHLAWMAFLPLWHEDEHAIYVHAGLPKTPDGEWLHPEDYKGEEALLWTRKFTPDCGYKGKLVVVGHTPTCGLGSAGFPIVGQHIIHMDTGTFLTGTLSLLELPSHQIYIAADPEWMKLAPNYKAWKEEFEHHPRSVKVDLGEYKRPRNEDYRLGQIRLNRYGEIGIPKLSGV
jgi:serine/threonine protein phosphatase 1